MESRPIPRKVHSEYRYNNYKKLTDILTPKPESMDKGWITITNPKAWEEKKTIWFIINNNLQVDYSWKSHDQKVPY